MTIKRKIAVLLFLIPFLANGQISSAKKLLLSNPCSDYLLCDSLLYYYKMDNNADIIDSISGYNITFTSGTPLVSGLLGTAYSFTGSDYSSAAGRAASDKYESRTISLWIKKTANPTSGTLDIFDDKESEPGTYFGFLITLNTSGQLSGGYSYGAGGVTTAVTTIDNSTWYNISVVQSVSGNSIISEVYIDGEFINKNTSVFGVSEVDGRWEGHTLNDGGDETGATIIIDDIKIWNRALDICDIRYNYNSGVGIECEIP